MDNDVARISEIPRPVELLKSSACQNFGEIVVSCYFATHSRVDIAPRDDLETICSKIGVNMEDAWPGYIIKDIHNVFIS